jgi:hypothetical protein
MSVRVALIAVIINVIRKKLKNQSLKLYLVRIFFFDLIKRKIKLRFIEKTKYFFLFRPKILMFKGLKKR